MEIFFVLLVLLALSRGFGELAERLGQPSLVGEIVAGTLLVRGAGGEVADLEGRPIDMLSHTGPLVAAIDARGRGAVVELARAALGDGRSPSR